MGDFNQRQKGSSVSHYMISAHDFQIQFFWKSNLFRVILVDYIFVQKPIIFSICPIWSAPFAFKFIRPKCFRGKFNLINIEIIFKSYERELVITDDNGSSHAFKKEVLLHDGMQLSVLNHYQNMKIKYMVSLLNMHIDRSEIRSYAKWFWSKCTLKFYVFMCTFWSLRVHFLPKNVKMYPYIRGVFLL